MLCCTSAPPMSSLSGSCENTGQRVGATKQMCGRGKALARCNGGGAPSRQASAAVCSRRLSRDPSLDILARDTHIIGLPGALTVHHSDRQPKKDLIGSRLQVAAGDAGDQIARQSGRCPLVESALGRVYGRIDAQRAKALPDMDEIGANE